MDLQVKVETIDRTSLIVRNTFNKTDNENDKVDTVVFSYLKYGTRTWTPSIEDEVIITDLDTSQKEFGGRIINIDKVLNRNRTVEFRVTCADYTVDFDDELVVQTFENQTVKQIIDAIKPSGFTSTNVAATIIIEKIQFNYQRKSDCIRDLSQLLNYHWYIDPDKDIHFFAKAGELAPFNITDSSASLIAPLVISVDSSQLKNRVYVLGGEEVGASRIEAYDADGDQDFFPLANKFSSKPVVEKNSVAQTVGVSPLEQFTDGPYEVLWNYNQKYIQFDTKPTSGDSIEITGTPLAKIAVVKEDSPSVSTYGAKEFKIDDINLADSLSARERAGAEIEAYKDGIIEGSFRTYTSGLRSGQTININSTLLGVNEDFVIKSVTLRWHNHSEGIYDVKLVSHRTIDIVEFFQNLLRDKDKLVSRAQNAILTIIKSLNETVNVQEEIGLDIEKTDHQTVNVAEQIRKDPWGAGVVTPVFSPYFPTSDSDPKRPGRFDRAHFQ